VRTASHINFAIINYLYAFAIVNHSGQFAVAKAANEEK
jgi:hypothetical protein